MPDTPSLTPPRPRWASGRRFMIFVAVVCGLAGGFGAIFFRALILIFQEAFFGGFDAVVTIFHTGFAAAADEAIATGLDSPWYWRLLAPALGGLIVGPLVSFLATEAKGHGVPEVIESVAQRGGVIRARVVAIKTLASAICIGSGGSVGREGPIVQIGSALASTVGRILRVPTRQLRTIVGCGAAAGIAATFNAPIAGALFAVEVIIGDFAVLQFSPIVISSVVATLVSRQFLGDFPAFKVPPYELVSPFELVHYAVLGVVAGSIGVLFTTVLYWSEDHFEELRVPQALKAALGGLLIGAIGIALPHVFGVGYGTINAALTGALPAAFLATLLFAKLVATSITIGSGGSGGIFAPSLFLGATAGGFIGTFIHQWFPEWTATSGSYALVGMGAVVSATTHAPITAIIIIFELTGNYTIIPGLMTACVVASLVAQFGRRQSIYTMKLVRRGIDIYKEEDPNVLKTLHVGDVIDRNPEVILESASFEDVLDLVVRSTHTEFFVVNHEEELLGAIYLQEVRRLILETDALSRLVVAEDLVERNRPTVTMEDNLDSVMQLFSSWEQNELAVVDLENPRKLVGSVHKRDVITLYNEEVMRRDLAGGMSRAVDVVGKVHQVELGDGYVLQEILAPSAFQGHSLRDLKLRGRTGVQVVLIRGLSKGHQTPSIRVPGPDDRVEPGDKLLVAGPKAAIDRLSGL